MSNNTPRTFAQYLTSLNSNADADFIACETMAIDIVNEIHEEFAKKAAIVDPTPHLITRDKVESYVSNRLDQIKKIFPSEDAKLTCVVNITMQYLARILIQEGAYVYAQLRPNSGGFDLCVALLAIDGEVELTENDCNSAITSLRDEYTK